MTIISTARSLIDTAIELPSALRECVEAKRAEDARRNSERDADVFGEANGPALYEANSKLDELKAKLLEANNRLAQWSLWSVFRFAIESETDDELRAKIEAEEDKLLASERKRRSDAERKLAREVEARRWRKQTDELPKCAPDTSVMWREVGETAWFSVTAGDLKLSGWENVEWRYPSPEDMP
jgi:uncharacterized membrane protein YukC